MARRFLHILNKFPIWHMNKFFLFWRIKLHFSIFRQIGSLLLARVRNLETSWISDLDDSASATDGSTMQMSSGRNASYLLASMFNPELDLTLDDRGVTHAIRQLNFIQMKRKLCNSFTLMHEKYTCVTSRMSLNFPESTFIYERVYF